MALRRYDRDVHNAYSVRRAPTVTTFTAWLLVDLVERWSRVRTGHLPLKK